MTATVQGGWLLGEVDRATQEYSLATPLGFISEVDVAGLTLGGGLGYLTPRFGWNVDNLLEGEIVTADGRVRRASHDEHPDLVWTVRGAGANFGVVTSFTFRLLFADCPIPGIDLGFLHIGGAINDRDEDDGAVGNRNSRYVIGANVMWEPDEPRAAEKSHDLDNLFRSNRNIHPLGTGAR